MKPIPVVFHLGPLQVHTYGIGLAITFWVAYRYFDRRLRRNGYPTDWVVGMFLWVIVSAVVGARAMHVLANLGYYSSHPLQVLLVWHGGLSSWGGLLAAVPTAVYVVHRRCPSLRIGRALDLVAPVLMAAWAMGRLLGPQLMVAGGGHPTTQWFGMYYADQVGKRLPVPIFQAMEDFAVFAVLLWVEHRCNRWPDGRPRTGYPPGAVLGTGMVLWGIERAVDEHLWLTTAGHLGAILVQLAGLALMVGGLALLAVTLRRWHAWLASPEALAAASVTMEARAGGGAAVEPASVPATAASPGASTSQAFGSLAGGTERGARPTGLPGPGPATAGSAD